MPHPAPNMFVKKSCQNSKRETLFYVTVSWMHQSLIKAMDSNRMLNRSKQSTNLQRVVLFPIEVILLICLPMPRGTGCSTENIKKIQNLIELNKNTFPT